MNIIDVSNIKSNGIKYNGNSKKRGITINGVNCIVKSAKDNDMSVYCEYIASAFIRSIGIECHEVLLGKQGKELVDLMRDFTFDKHAELHSFSDTRQSSEDSEIDNKEYTYDDVLYLIDKHLKMTDVGKIEAKQHFWKMFIADAIIGNRDRHWGNWGYLKYKDGYRFAPLYDNGGGLYPGVNRWIQQYIDLNTRQKFLSDRIFMVPASLFKIKGEDRAHRTNYYEMFKDLRINRIFAEQVKILKSKLKYQDVFNNMIKICSTVPLGVEFRRFYVEIVTMRYMCIVLRIEFDRAYNIIEGALTNYG